MAQMSPSPTIAQCMVLLLSSLPLLKVMLSLDLLLFICSCYAEPCQWLCFRSLAFLFYKITFYTVLPSSLCLLIVLLYQLLLFLIMNRVNAASFGPGDNGTPPTKSVDRSIFPVSTQRSTKPYSHVFASNKNSSKRTRAAFMSSLDADLGRSRNARKHARQRLNQKLSRIKNTHDTVEILRSTTSFSVKDVKEKVLVFDGGTSISTLLPDPPSSNNIFPCNVANSMFIPDSDPDVGLILRDNHDANGPPIFLHPPRTDTLKFTGLHSIEASNLLYSSFLSALHHTNFVNKRGIARQTFTKNKVANLGSQACLGQTGVRQDSYHKSKMSASDWDMVINHIKVSENLFKHVMHPDVIRHTTEAHKSVGYKLMLPSSGLEEEGTTIFSAINITQDAYL